MNVSNIFLTIFVLFTGLVACSSNSDPVAKILSISGGLMKNKEDVINFLKTDKIKDHFQKIGKEINLDNLNIKDMEEMIPRLLEVNSESFGVALLMLGGGLFIAYMGIRLFKPFLAVSGLIVGGGTFFFIYQKIIVFFPGFVAPEWAHYVVIALGGVLGATLFIKAWDIGTYILCAYGGVMLAILVKGMIAQYEFGAKVDQNLLMVAFAALGLFFARFIRDAAIICTSALSGAFLIFLGLDNLKTVGFRKFIKDAIANKGKNVSTNSFEGEIGYCLIGVVIVTITGIYIQYQNRPKSKNEE